ncbi:hypothetical protein [Pseudidiomarina sediminum]|uniref:hypothetical protein n=1 Tax=Pseudidiomarina sediminum TaxID=431675 RepID=UPI001C98DE0F|nr:hypothetical protein [Pseudidiomarina sediminum]MBY6062900.1 hypothetical protein [Pseudidiomarina sediminum]
MHIVTILTVVATLALSATTQAQDQAKTKDASATTTDEAARQAKFKAGKALADTVKATDSGHLDDDDDGDGLGNATATMSETKRKRPGRIKTGDVTLANECDTDCDSATDTTNAQKSKKKGGNNR